MFANGYGIFRDELYYLANAQHLAWGYVDHPPLVAVLAWVVQQTLGTSLLALRTVPAIAAGAVVLFTTLLVRQLGGGRAAQLLAGMAVALTPVYLSLFTIFSMNAVDLVVWAGLALILARMLRTSDGRLWLAFGSLAGLGLQNKISVAVFGFGVAVGLVAAREWTLLRDRRLWIGGAIAALLFAPHVIWQVVHGWPTLEFMRRATEFKNASLSPAAFLAEQVLMLNPIAAPLWVAGLIGLLTARSMRPFRTLGWAYVAALLVMLTQNAKSYYLAPIYPVLFAAGAVLVERASRRPRLAWLPAGSLAAVIASGLALAPLAKPLLPVETYVSCASALGVGPMSSERHELGRLPQFFANSASRYSTGTLTEPRSLFTSSVQFRTTCSDVAASAMAACGSGSREPRARRGFAVSSQTLLSVAAPAIRRQASSRWRLVDRVLKEWRRSDSPSRTGTS